MADVHPCLDQSIDNSRPPCFDQYISQAMISMGIKTTSKNLTLDREAIINRAMELYTKQRWRAMQLPADAAWRSDFVTMLRGIKPDSKIGRYIKNLQIFGCSRYLLESSDASDVICLIGNHAQSLRLLYIWSKDGYIDWLALSDELRARVEYLMQRVQVLVLERVKNIPLSLFCSLKNLRALDLALVQLATSTTTSRIVPGIKKMAIHDAVTKSGQGSETLNSVDALMQSSGVSLNALTTLYLDYLGCKGCANVWKEVIGRCRDTIQYLRVYCGDGTETIDLGVLSKIRSLHLIVAANGRSVDFLCELLNTLSIPGRGLSELKLGVDARETGNWSWTDTDISRNRESWKAVDKSLAQILGLSKRVQFMLSIPETKQTDREAAQKAVVEMIPESRKWLQLPVRFVAEGDGWGDLTSSFSLVEEEISTFI